MKKAVVGQAVFEKKRKSTKQNNLNPKYLQELKFGSRKGTKGREEKRR